MPLAAFPNFTDKKKTATSTVTGLPGLPDAGQRTFATGIPGFEELSGLASGNVRNELAGTEDPSITRNINAQWGAGSGLAPGSEFLNNRAVDLYGQRGEARKAQGMKDLLSMLGTYSGTVTATPGEVLGSEQSQRQNALEQQRFAEQQRQFNEQLAFQRQQEAERLALENQRFGFDKSRYNDIRKSSGPPFMDWWHQLYGAGIGGGALDSAKLRG